VGIKKGSKVESRTGMRGIIVRVFNMNGETMYRVRWENGFEGIHRISHISKVAAE
jgi:hypothetical protein